MPMPTTVGSVAVPLGQTRLQIARLIAMMIMTGQDCVIAELANLGTLSVLMVSNCIQHRSLLISCLIYCSI